MKEQNTIEFVGILVKQPLGEFYIGKLSGKILNDFAAAEVRNMKEVSLDQRLGIQRELSLSRVKEIKEYVRTSDACFPNSVILSTKEENIVDIKELHEGIYKIELTAEEDTFQIIDGQHRIAGLEGYDGEFELNVSLFLDMDTEQQAILFSTINIKQKKVPTSLMMDLLAMQKARNPIKSAHYISRVLNDDPKSGLYQKISPFAVSRSVESKKITQATFIQKVVDYISGSTTQQIKDRDALKNGQLLVYADDKIKKRLIFRNMFIDERDAEIAVTISNYFSAVSKRWPKGWNDENYILSKTIGFTALMKFLRYIYSEIGRYDAVISEEEFLDILNQCNVLDECWEKGNFSISASGESEIIKTLREGLGS